MKTVKLNLTLAIIAGSAALAAQTGFAQPSSLSITNPVIGATNVLWDLSKLTNELQMLDLTIHKVRNGQTNTEVEVVYAAPCDQDSRGKLAGGPGSSTVSVISSDGTTTNDFQGTYVSRGSVSGTKGVAHLAFATRAFGTGFLEGKNRTISAGANYTVKFDAVNDLVTGRSVQHASASGLGSVSESRAINGDSNSTLHLSDLSDELGDGTWALVLNFTNAPSVTKLGGTATVSLQSGNVYPFTFTGTFAPRTGQSKVNLKGHDAGLGCILQVTLNTNNAITRIVGRVSGQTVNIKQ